jgi:PAS domain S-box-containing protein
MIIVEHPTGAILDVNPFAARLLGRARADLIGAPAYALEVFANAGIRQQTVLELREAESLRREVRFARRDGKWIHTEILANIYHEGERLVVQFNLRDLRGRRPAARAPEGDDDRIARDLETAGRVAASISRNFGNDLTAILNLCDLLLQNGAAAPFEADVRSIREAANRAVALDWQLLAFGRHDTGRRERVNVNAVLGEMGQLIGTVIGDRYAFTTRVEPALPAIEGNRAQIERIILNLLMNVRRPSPARGSISVETANVTIDEQFSAEHPAVEPGEYVSISITDSAQQTSTSPGSIADAYQVDASQPLGFPAAFDAIRELGGQVWAFSELGVGSTVRVFFRPAREEKPKEAAPPETRGSETILMIDSDTVPRAAAARALRAHGYQVLEARSIEEALRIAEGEGKSVDLILLDVNHSEESKPEAAIAAAKAMKSKLAYTSSETDAVLTSHGVLNDPEILLRKPFSAEQMAIFVRAVLRGIQ